MEKSWCTNCRKPIYLGPQLTFSEIEKKHRKHNPEGGKAEVWRHVDTEEATCGTYAAPVTNLEEMDLARSLGISVTELRGQSSITQNQLQAKKIKRAQQMTEAGYSNLDIAKAMGISEAFVRNLLEKVHD
jgi:hypothetical protein